MIIMTSMSFTRIYLIRNELTYIEVILVVVILDYVRKDVGLWFSGENSEEGAYIAEEPPKSQT